MRRLITALLGTLTLAGVLVPAAPAAAAPVPPTVCRTGGGITYVKASNTFRTDLNIRCTRGGPVKIKSLEATALVVSNGKIVGRADYPAAGARVSSNLALSKWSMAKGATARCKDGEPFGMKYRIRATLNDGTRVNVPAPGGNPGVREMLVRKCSNLPNGARRGFA